MSGACRRTGVLGLALLALSGCGAGVDRRAVEAAQLAIVAQCDGPRTTDERALRSAVEQLAAAYREKPAGAFRFEGSRAETSMPAEVRLAADRLLVCRPALARDLTARTIGADKAGIP